MAIVMRRTAILGIVGLFALLALTSLPAQQTRPRDLRLSKAMRRALVIGNNNYGKAPPLHNAVNDANDLAAVLRELEFQVEVVTNADRQAMERAIRKFTGSLEAGDVAFFHFSGHGLQIDGDNFLIPVDFELSDEVGAKYDAYSASEIHDRIAASKAALNIVTLDACRNNGFRSFRGGSTGLAAMNAARGSFLAFATGPGRTADDNPNGRNGRFTAAMLSELREPGLELGQVFRRVREHVIDGTGGRQVPWTSSSVVGEFYFLIDDTPETAPTRGEDVAQQMELTYWNSIKDTDDPDAFESYVERYPQGTFTTLARLKLGRLRTPPPPPQAPRESAAPRVESAPPPKEQTTQPPRQGEVRVNAVDGLEYVWVPPGTFMMGCVSGDEYCKENEKPRHEVMISEGFWIGRTETTLQAYEESIKATGQSMPPNAANNPELKPLQHPIHRATWPEAEAYCIWAGGRLPTEAEWEYAARGGKAGLTYPNGNELSEGDAHFGVSNRNPLVPVGTLAANGYGLHDMAGNAAEWVADWYSESYYRRSASRDPKGPASGAQRVTRGGSWFEYRWDLRASRREALVPQQRQGFRCALDTMP